MIWNVSDKQGNGRPIAKSEEIADGWLLFLSLVYLFRGDETFIDFAIFLFMRSFICMLFKV